MMKKCSDFMTKIFVSQKLQLLLFRTIAIISTNQKAMGTERRLHQHFSNSPRGSPRINLSITTRLLLLNSLETQINPMERFRVSNQPSKDDNHFLN